MVLEGFSACLVQVDVCEAVGFMATLCISVTCVEEEEEASPEADSKLQQPFKNGISRAFRSHRMQVGVMDEDFVKLQTFLEKDSNVRRGSRVKRSF